MSGIRSESNWFDSHVFCIVSLFNKLWCLTWTIMKNPGRTLNRRTRARQRYVNKRLSFHVNIFQWPTSDQRNFRWRSIEKCWTQTIRGCTHRQQRKRTITYYLDSWKARKNTSMHLSITNIFISLIITSNSISCMTNVSSKWTLCVYEKRERDEEKAEFCMLRRHRR